MPATKMALGGREGASHVLAVILHFPMMQKGNGITWTFRYAETKFTVG
jgi:hypothetical protein